jgi:hypothetical protein
MWQTEQRSKPSTQFPQRKRGPTIGEAPQALGVGRGSFVETSCRTQRDQGAKVDGKDKPTRHPLVNVACGCVAVACRQDDHDAVG